PAAPVPAVKPSQQAPASPVETAKPVASRKPPAPPSGMVETSIPVKTKNVGAIPWRLMVYE
ncbi:MAG: hypothetical protein J5985_02140, partial [Kiritimatiellae bacterium]|nr:hypothetical protein [Kiritimatiellia bacterium]